MTLFPFERPVSAGSRLITLDLTSVAEWVKVGAYSAAMKAVCRASNRVFVGLPICMVCPPLLALRVLSGICRPVFRIRRTSIKVRSTSNSPGEFNESFPHATSPVRTRPFLLFLKMKPCRLGAD